MGKGYSALIMLLPSLIQFAEDVYGAKTGKKKLTTVTTLAQSAILTASIAGVVDPDLATNTIAITDAIERTVSNMKNGGQLKEVKITSNKK